MSLRARTTAPVSIVLARARRRPRRWLLAGLGLALAAAFAGTVLAESTIAGDAGAHAALAAVAPQDRVVRVTWPALLNPEVQRTARALLAGLLPGAQTEVVLLNPGR
jgi:hypothetical protein